MSSTYSIAITGIKAGVTKETATKQLVELLKVTEEKVASIIESQKFVVKSGVDLKTSVKYEEALSQCGWTSISEPEPDTLSFDLETPSNFSQQPETSEPSTSLRASLASVSLAISFVLVVMALYFSVSSFGLFKIFKGESKFDQATQIGISTRVDIDEFKNSGGLENDSESTWRGYKVTSYNAVFDDQTDLLGMITIGLFGAELHTKKFANINNVKKSLSKECGKKWTQNEAQRMSNMHVATNDGMSCAIHITESGLDPVQVTLMMDPETLRSTKQQSNETTSSNSAEERISQCVDQRVLDYRKTPGYEDAVIKKDIGDEFEAECRAKVGSTK